MTESGRMENSKILTYCKNTFGGIWQKQTEESVTVKELPGGLSNSIFLVEIKDAESIQKSDEEVVKVLVRIYGEIRRSSFHMVLQDTAVSAILAEKGLLPKLYAVFPEGRLEQYLENVRNLTVEEYRQDSCAEEIARQLYQIHQLDIPLTRRPETYFEMFENILNDLTESRLAYEAGNTETVNLVRKSFRNRAGDMFDYIKKNDVAGEARRFKHLLFEDLKDLHTIVYSHNDAFPGNILVLNDGSEKLQLKIIDFEYGAYNIRGFDLGMNINERAFQIGTKLWPGYSYNPDLLPTEQQQMKFLRAYFSQSPNPSLLDSAEELYKLKKEISIGMAYKSFQTAIYCFKLSLVSNMEIGILEHGILRYELFMKELTHFKETYRS